MAREIKRYSSGHDYFITPKKVEMIKPLHLNLIDCKIPTIGWKKPVYAVMDGKLRQVLIKRIEFYTRNVIACTNFFTPKYAAYILDVAGIGEVFTFQMGGWHNLNFDLFESVEDFKSNEPYDYSSEGERVGFYEMMRSALGDEERYTIGLDNNLYQWVWNNQECTAKKVLAKIPSAIIYTDNDGFFFNEPWILEDVYATKEECVDDNEVEVVTFDDSNEKITNKRKIAFLGCVVSADKEDINAIFNLMKELGMFEKDK